MEPEVLISIIVGGGVFLVYLIAISFLSQHKETKRKQQWHKKLKDIADASLGPAESDISNKLFKDHDKSNDFIRGSSLAELKTWLLRAGLEMNPLAFCATASIFGAISSVLLFIFVHPGIVLTALVGIALALFTPLLFVSYLIKRRRKKFLQSFPIALDIIRRAIKAGFTPLRAIETVTEQLEGPVGEAFKTIKQKMELGESLDRALTQVAEESDVYEFRLLAIVVILQQETGGNLSDILQNFAAIIRNREILKKKVNALVSEGKLGGIVVACLPIFITGIVGFNNPQFMDPLLEIPQGKILLAIAVGLLVSGIFSIFYMVNRDYY